MAMMRNGLSIISATQASVINSLVKVFDSQLTDLVSECPTATDDLYLNCARVQIQAFYFFAKSDYVDVIGITELYSIAQALIDNGMALNESHQLAAYCSTYIYRTIFMAALSILKIFKSNLRPFLNLRSGERSYFTAIRFLKESSLQNDDLAARAAAILSQLWTSDRIFKKSNGQVDSLALRLRTRGSMSVVFDCLWWWREEFAGQSSPFSDMKTPAKEDVIFPEPTPNAQGPECPMTIMDDTPLAGDFPPIDYVPDYDWVASLNFPLGNMDLPLSSLET